jgi:hypothetical protein
MDPKDRQELHELLSVLLDGALGAEQQDRLGELLRQHAEAREFYLAYFGLHADLALRGEQRDFLQAPLPTTAEGTQGQPIEAEQPEVEPPRAFPVRGASPPPSHIPHRSRFVLWGALGLSGLAAALLVALLIPWQRPRDVSTSEDQAAEATDSTVAVLLQAPGAVWGETNLSTRTGAPLAPGWLRLKSGFAQIEFYSGATVILEGPAELQLISRMEAYCARGKLRATVPPQAQGFTIGSPELALVDRGTEFGLEVGAGGKTEVHVFQGKVELHNPGSPREALPPKELTTGQGVRLDDPGIVRPIELNPAGFQTAQDLAARSREATRRRQQDWLAASEALRRDPSLLVYYPFEAEQPWSRTLLDQARGRQQPQDGAIVGCSWAAGRWQGKRGLEFKRVGDRVRLHVPGEFDALTLAAWVRVDALPNRNNSLFMTDGWKEGAAHWQIGDAGMLILGVKAPREVRNAHYHAPGVLTPERWGQWLHLAVVYDRLGGLVTQYVDGRSVMQEPVLLDIPLRLGDAEIGNWSTGPGGSRQPIRNFSGCMDEFMLFSRPLSAVEIEQLYNQGRPPS